MDLASLLAGTVVAAHVVTLGLLARAVLRQEIGQLLTFATVGAAAGAAILGEVASRLSNERWMSWFGSALALYAVVVLPSTVVDAGPGPAAAMLSAGRLVAYGGVVALFVLPLRAPPLLRRRHGWVLAGVAALATAATMELAAELPGVARFTDPPFWARLAVLTAWCSVSLGYVVSGYRRRSRPMALVGVGMALIASAHLSRAISSPADGDTALLFVVLRLVGVMVMVVVLAHATRLTMGRVRLLQDRQQEDLRIASVYLHRAADTARERDHELRAGLLGLSAITQLVSSREHDAEQERLRTAVLSELGRLQAMLERPETVAPAPMAFAVTPVVDHLVTLHRRSGMDVRLRTWGEPWSRGRPTALAEAVTNLLTNAARHAPGSAVLVAVQRRAGCVVVEVCDEGPGIDPRNAERLFERGVRNGPTGGEGLGLHLARRLVTELGGSIMLHSCPGRRGCVAVIEVPAAPPPVGRP